MKTLTPNRLDVAVELPQVVVDAPSTTRRRVGVALSAVATAAATTWLAWRIVELHWNPVSLVVLAAELVGVAGAVAVTVGLARSGVARIVHLDAGDGRDIYCFAFAVADIVGRTRSADLHRDVRTAVRAAPRWRPRDAADAAIAAVLADGPRRLVLVVAVGVGLLVGLAPFGAPPWWAVAALVTATLCFGASHVVLGRGRLRLGDRIRWSYGAIGEVVERSDVVAHAPRRWRGALAAAVGLSLAIGLRGTSDRWTHGLGPMSHDERVVALAVATVLILGALFTLQTSARPDTGESPVLVRHLDERTARQSLLAVAVCVGTVGLLAGASTPDLAVPAGGVGEPGVDPDTVTVADTGTDTVADRSAGSGHRSAVTEVVDGTDSGGG